MPPPPDPPPADDARQLEALFRAHHAALCAFARRYVGDEARAEELVQELFLAVWAARAERPIAAVTRAYLFGAVRHRGLNVRRRDLVECDWADDAAGDAVRALHPAPSPADAPLDAAELRARLAAGVAALPPRCRLVMLLRWEGGLSHAEVAEVLEISPKAVERQITRGLRALRAWMG